MPSISKAGKAIDEDAVRHVYDTFMGVTLYLQRIMKDAFSATAAAFTKRHRLKSPSAVQAASKRLLEYDLITRHEGLYSIADPLLALWLKTNRL